MSAGRSNTFPKVSKRSMLRGTIESRAIVSARINVAIICSGKDYQFAAALAAATYRKQMAGEGAVIVYLPAGEKRAEQLIHLADRYSFGIHAFPFVRVSDRKYTSQLKCQGFYEAVQSVPDGELLLLADADTYCRKPIDIDDAACQQLLAGKLGMVRDVMERHEKRQKAWWYVEPERRLPYVNSGVIFTSHLASPLFDRFREMAMDPLFLSGPFNDQTIINVALANEFRGIFCCSTADSMECARFSMTKPASVIALAELESSGKAVGSAHISNAARRYWMKQQRRLRAIPVQVCLKSPSPIGLRTRHSTIIGSASDAGE